MMFQRTGPIALGALGYALALLSDSVLAYSSTTLGCIPSFIADGDCDLQNDNEDCDYDGGDCCECTCVSTAAFTCGENGGFSCLDPSAPCVDDDDVTTLPPNEVVCVDNFIADGDCDDTNNFEQCGYDGGDCCECTCVSTEAFTCGDEGNGGFDCQDPSAPIAPACVDDDDDDMSASYSYQMSIDFSSCVEERIGDGDCQLQNNNEECGYDGGDCCECTCDFSIPYACDLYFDPVDCVDPHAPCVIHYVDAGTRTTVGVSSNGYDARPSHMGGCMDDGCAPGLTRDGITDQMESRWSCSQDLVPDGEYCEIEYTFDSPQHIADIQVAFPYEANSSRQLEVLVNGGVVRTFALYLQPWLTYNGLGVNESDVHTVTLRYTDTAEHEWISILEVRFLVEP
ncbi:unnamed protein product [Laminaria digitata]